MIEIRRYECSPDGTIGTFWIDNEFLCYTLEDPDNNNHKGDSCIPEGVYKVAPHSGTKFKDVWILKDVPNRDAILIHNGNTIEDTHGCILVGRKSGFLNGLPAVLESNMALRELRKKLPRNFTLTIRRLK